MSIIYLKDQRSGSKKPKDMRSAVHEHEIDGFNQKLVICIGHLNRLYEFIGGSFRLSFWTKSMKQRKLVLYLLKCYFLYGAVLKQS